MRVPCDPVCSADTFVEWALDPSQSCVLLSASSYRVASLKLMQKLQARSKGRDCLSYVDVWITACSGVQDVGTSRGWPHNMRMAAAKGGPCGLVVQIFPCSKLRDVKFLNIVPPVPPKVGRMRNRW